MRALCGAVISAGALVGLGLAAIAVGIRYQNYDFRNDKGDPQWVYFWQMDVSLIMAFTLLVAAFVVGLGIAFVGLAYHHQRRHHEHLRSLGDYEDSKRLAVK
jgi:putative Mn2+ efflux pump MntP